MYNNVSEGFITAINRPSRTFRSRITVNGSVISDIKSYSLSSGSCGSEVFSIGTVFSAYVNLILPIQDTSFAAQEMFLETGIVKDNDTIEYIPMGYFTAIPSDIVKSRDQIVIKASDRITSKCRRGYLASVTFPASIGSILTDIGSQIGVSVITSLPTSGTIESALPIMSCAEALGYIAGLLGGFCYADRTGNIRIEPFPDEASLEVSKDRIYQLSANESEYALNRLSVTVTVGEENSDGEEEESIIYSSGAGEGLDLYNPYMTQDLFNALATRMLGYSYSPGTVDFLGDPRLDPVDAIAAQNYEDTEYIIPCMNIIQTFDGGLKTTVSAPGIVSSDEFAQGPLSQQVESLETDMSMAKKAVDIAKASAISATNSANNALVQLSVVEDVAGTLRWISEHGDYVETEDTTVRPGTVYFIHEHGDYIPIASPDPTKNPSAEGWYVLDISQSTTDYIMAHLAVTTYGLWVLPVNNLAEHYIQDSNGNLIIDSNGNKLVDFSDDPQKASGYKVLISGGTSDPNFPIGLSIYNDEGELIANYGTETTIGSTNGYNTHIDTNGFYVRDELTVLAKYGSIIEFYETTNHTVAAEVGSTGLVIKKGSIQIGSKTSASDVTNSGTYIDSSGNMATSNIKAHGGTIGGFDLSLTQLNAYGTGSGAGTSDTGISRVLIQSAPGTGTNIAFGVANRVSTSDSWVWTSYIRHNGSFVSTKGTIGGWTIDENKLSRSDGNNNTVKLISTGMEITADNPYGSQQLVNQTKLSQGSILLKHYDTSYMSEATITAKGILFDSFDTAPTVTLYGDPFNATPYVRVGERYTQQSTTYYRSIQLYYNLDSGACGLWHQSTNDGFSYSPFWINDNTDIVIEGDNEIDLLIRTDHTGSDLARIVFYQALDTNLVFRPNGDNLIYLGTSANRWKGIYGVTVRATDIYGNIHDTSSSDLKEKSILENHDWKIDEFIQGLKPIAFKWKEGSTGRIHMGFGAQDVAKLTKDLKIGDLSVYSAEVKTDGEFNEPYHGEEIEDSKLSWTLRYTELIAPMVMEIQRLMNRVKELEDRLNG